jgi:hypothetical protein
MTHFQGHYSAAEREEGEELKPGELHQRERTDGTALTGRERTPEEEETAAEKGSVVGVSWMYGRTD